MPGKTHQHVRIRDGSPNDLSKLVDHGYLYAVMDACNLPLAPRKALEVGKEKAVSLYRGSAEEEFWEVAPYLIKVDQQVLDWLRANAKSDAWGIFVATKSDLDTVRHHLRHFLKVQAPGGDIWLFRFYDPRVLEFFLPTCSAVELSHFFGPIIAWGIAPPKFQEIKFWQEKINRRSTDTIEGSHVGVPIHFRIRPEQEKEFEKYAEQVFLRETILYVKEQHANKVEGLAEEVIAQRVRSAIQRARSYGLKLEGSILFFLALMFDIAPNFHEHPRIHQALIEGTDSPDVRIDELLDNTSDEDWDQAEDSYNESKWQYSEG